MKKIYWQEVRGVCIVAVLLIHVIAQYSINNGNQISLIIVRQFLNFSVPTFIFISGYFMKKAKSVKKYYLSRVKRLLIPYLLWSILYCIIRGTSIAELMRALFLGTGSWQLYYIIVLLQCVLISPFLYKLEKTYMCGGVLFAIILFLINIVIKYVGLINGIDETEFPFCIEYLPFYAWGIHISYINKKNSVGEFIHKIVAVIRNYILYIAILGAVVSIIEALFWSSNNNWVMAMSQGKITSYFYATSVIGVFLLYNETEVENNVLINKVMEKIGNVSYGLFYIHMFWLVIVNKILKLYINNIFGYCIVVFLCVFIGSYATVLISKKVLPIKIVQIIGFS